MGSTTHLCILSITHLTLALPPSIPAPLYILPLSETLQANLTHFPTKYYYIALAQTINS